jgi:hypothetical protein
MSYIRRYRYTVMIGNGVGEFLWRKERDDPSKGVGGNLYSLMEEWLVPEEFSAELFRAFCEWARWWMSTDPQNWDNPRELDFAAFNKRGIDLARRLKHELGPESAVFYWPATQDYEEGNSAFEVA